MTERAPSLDDTRAALLAGYRPRPGVADELFDENGEMRPVWTPFVNHLSTLSEAEIAERFARGDRHLRDTGVFYRQYDAAQQPERDWPLSHIPVLLHDREWEGILHRPGAARGASGACGR